MVAPNPLAARRRTNSSSCSVAVPSSWEESVVSGAIAKRFAISRPQLNLKGDQTNIDQTSDILQAGRHRLRRFGILPHAVERAVRSCLVVLVVHHSDFDSLAVAG